MLDALSVGQQGLKENFKKRCGESLKIPDILAVGPRGIENRYQNCSHQGQGGQGPGHELHAVPAPL